jgi:glycosyltransferase involved in cell wall biosynthesis
MSVTIIIPTFNRKKFEKLIEHNINIQDYNNIVEVIIADDSDIDDVLELNIKYPIKYIKCPRINIGQKRNLLASHCKTEFIAHMDTDDIYFSTYISHSIFMINKKKCNVVGTSDMIFLFSDGTKGKLLNPLLSMANEATLVYKKTFWEKKGFNEVASNEAIQLLMGRHWEIANSDITKVMICICHSSNSVDKEPWRNHNIINEIPDISEHKLILDTISL